MQSDIQLAILVLVFMLSFVFFGVLIFLDLLAFVRKQLGYVKAGDPRLTENQKHQILDFIDLQMPPKKLDFSKQGVVTVTFYDGEKIAFLPDGRGGEAIPKARAIKQG